MKLHEEKLALLRAAVAARVTYWDAMNAIEHLYLGDGDVSDRVSDGLEQLISGFASDTDQSTSWIGLVHVEQLDEVMSR